MGNLIAKIRHALGFCEHRWEHASNHATWGGVYEVLMCTKCFKFKLGDKWKR